MSDTELAHVAAGRVSQLEGERDRLCVERDTAEADGDAARAAELQDDIDELVEELDKGSNMVCIEVKQGGEWERVKGKYATERDATKAINEKKKADANGRGRSREYRVVPFAQ